MKNDSGKLEKVMENRKGVFMQIEFKKYVAAGNDFLVFREEDLVGVNYNDLAYKVCNRRFSLGSDGILIASHSNIADIKMLYYNSDGSQGEMCGNGIRSFSKYIYEESIVEKECFTIETLDGLKYIELTVEKGEVKQISVNMGKATLEAKKIPVMIESDIVIDEVLDLGFKKYKYSAVRLGVPHLVIFMDKVDKSNINEYGKKIENLDIFPEKINVNFVEVVDSNNIEIFTWERGAGRTLGCGTGSSSAVYLGNYKNLLSNEVNVKTEGGALKVLIDEDIYMIGSAELIASGKLLYRRD